MKMRNLGVLILQILEKLHIQTMLCVFMKHAKSILKVTLELNVLTLSWNSSSSKLCQGTWMTGRWLETLNMASQREKSCLTKPVAFYNRVTLLMDKRRATEQLSNYLEICKSFDVVLCNVIVVKLERYGLMDELFNG